MKRRWSFFVIILTCLLTLLGCASEAKIKQNIFDLVEENYELIANACTADDIDILYNIKGIQEIKTVDGYICFYCEGGGIVPSSQEYGFYYSSENLPIAVFDGQILCETDDLVPEGEGFQYIDSGYNSFYTEHIIGNFYYYSAYF